MKIFLKRSMKHPLGVLYSALLGFIAFSAAVPMLNSGAWDAALVDLVMAAVLITLMLKTFVSTFRRESSLLNKITAWSMLAVANILALLPSHDFPGSLSTALAFSLVICALVLYFSGTLMAKVSIVPALWCCVFMPYHEEFMLMLSYPLRLSATTLSSLVLKICGVEVAIAGTSLNLPDLNIAITDACSGINQLDAFILIAFIAVEVLHKKTVWKLLHFAFMIPAIIAGNSLRIVITVLLYKILGDCVLENLWHTLLGYTQIFFAIILFLLIGRIFRENPPARNEVEQ
ncbi:MAG: exosortase/archaeosortase family protein [Lentisphaerae bacterium]|nr:exosortase/archaeosortase family protein [Lentisphaerota bacterium]